MSECDECDATGTCWKCHGSGGGPCSSSWNGATCIAVQAAGPTGILDEALQAAVEAAAKAWYATYQHDPATDPDGRYPLRRAILAAAPHLISEGRRQAAEDIRMADPGLGWSVLSPERAARIAEGKVDQ